MSLAQDLRSALEERRPGGRAGDVCARLCKVIDRMLETGEMPPPYTGPRTPEGERARAELLASIDAEEAAEAEAASLLPGDP